MFTPSWVVHFSIIIWYIIQLLGARNLSDYQEMKTEYGLRISALEIQLTKFNHDIDNV